VGGYGSGRRRSLLRKPRVEHYLALDVNALARAGFLKPGTTGEWTWREAPDVGLRVSVATDGEAIVVGFSDVEQTSVRLASSPCNFGGRRRLASLPTARLWPSRSEALPDSRLVVPDLRRPPLRKPTAEQFAQRSYSCPNDSRETRRQAEPACAVPTPASGNEPTNL